MTNEPEIAPMPEAVELTIVSQPAGAMVYWGHSKVEAFHTGETTVLRKPVLKVGVSHYPVTIRKVGFRETRLEISAEQLRAYSAGHPVVINVGSLEAADWRGWVELHRGLCQGALGVTVLVILAALGYKVRGYRERQRLDRTAYFRSLEGSRENDPLVGQHFGPYYLLEKLGSGGMASVYRAISVRDGGEQIAVKILHNLKLEERARQRYYSEVRLGAKLRHPNVVLLYEPIDHKGQLGLAMQMVAGISLRQFCRQQTVPGELIRSFILQMGAALTYLHQQGIIHRDLKPDNFMVSDGLIIKLMDFGIAIEQGAERKTHIVDGGGVVGTVTYMSPEQIRGQELTVQTDQYALGVVMYELLTGRAPFVDELTQRVALQHLNVTPVPPSFLEDGLPEAVDAPILRMLEKSPAARYASVDEACQAVLLALSEDRPRD